MIITIEVWLNFPRDSSLELPWQGSSDEESLENSIIEVLEVFDHLAKL